MGSAFKQKRGTVFPNSYFRSMASFDGSSSLDKACDEFRGYECGPSSRRRKTRVADHYCMDCPEYLCGDCKDYHGDLAGIMNILSCLAAEFRLLSGVRTVQTMVRHVLELPVVSTKASLSSLIVVTTTISSETPAKRSITTHAKSSVSTKKVHVILHQD